MLIWEGFNMRNDVATSGLLVFCAALLLGSSAAHAMGGGGGGGGGTPSASAPAYNPAEEYRKGIAALNDKNFKDAARAFGHVLDSAPKDANTNYLAGVSYAGLEDYKKARGFFEKAIKYDDALIPAHKDLGLAYVKLGDKGKANAELSALRARAEKCGENCPEAADLKAAISALATALGDGQQARLDVSPSLLFTSADAGDHAYLEAVALINEHRYEDAIGALQNAEKAFGPHPDVLTYLGFANRKLRRYELAESYYLKALAIAPGHRGATEYYGELMVERGDLAGARAKLAALDASCAFGCAEAEELRRWIAAGHAPG
jgi:tetratricopeptide (TPR) repeat protein